MPHTFDTASEARLAQCDARLAGVFREAIKRAPFGFRIVQSARTMDQQRAYFQAGRSKVNPDAYDTLPALYRAAKHITGPGMPHSRAVDVALVGKDPYNKKKLTLLAGIIRNLAQEVGLSIRWGGDFDKDGKPYEPGTFIDAPHFEIHE